MDHVAILEDYEQRMPPSRADKYLGLKNCTVSAAIRRGEIRPYRFKESPERAWVTPMMLAEWLQESCRDKADADGASADA